MEEREREIEEERKVSRMLKITVKIEEKNLKKNKEKIGKKNLIRDDFHERMHSTLLYFDAGSSTIKSSHRCFMFNKSMFLRFFEDDFFRCSLTLLSLSLSNWSKKLT